MRGLHYIIQLGVGRCVFLRSALPFDGSSSTIRKFTSQDASAALRPFYFIVHPDLFGQYPVERAVNENSLKSLNEYLALSSGSRRRETTQKLVFYIRAQNTFGEEALQEVKITLCTPDLRATVMKILNSVGLSDEHVPKQSSTTPDGNRPVEWHPSFYAATGRKDPHREDQPHKHSPVTLRSWLHSNIELSRKHQKDIQFNQDDTARRLHKLKEDLGLVAIHFDSPWGVQHFRGCLMSFDRLVRTHQELIHSVLKGKTLVFSNSTGVSRLGEIILSSEDVPQAWVKLLKSVSSYEAVLNRLPTMEATLSELLNGAQIVRREKRLGHIMAEKYELLLDRLLNSLRRCQGHVYQTFGEKDLSHLQIRVETEHNPLMLSSLGQFLIPASVPGPMVVGFISENMDKAALILMEIPSLLAQEETICADTIKVLALADLEKDESISPSQMISCCSRLLQASWRLLDTDGSSTLQGSRLRVSHYFSVMQDGLICIKWDWNGDDYT